MERKRIGVVGNSQPYRWLFAALGELFPVEFLHLRLERDLGLDAVLVLEGNPAAGLPAAAEGLPAYVVVASASATEMVTSEVRFGGSSLLDSALRHQVMMERSPTLTSPVSLQEGDEVLATIGGSPLWVSRPSGRSACQFVSVAPPALREGELLLLHLNGDSCLRLLPLLNFLRQLTAGPNAWQVPASRACLIFDDPSLYWPSYGFIDYRRLSAHALSHGYCAAIATIPLDAWWVHREVAAIFQASRPRLSLVVHGNNHTSRELSRPADGRGSLLAIATQAMRRMERLERNSGIAFHRIMEAPHAVVAYEVFAQLLLAGYEAALCSSELLVQHNAHVAWPTTFGLRVSEVLGGGLPVLPRIRLASDWRKRVCLAAFLRQPILLAGHHQDAADGMGRLAEVARMVNSLPGVNWSDIPGILHTNFLYQQSGELLRVKLYSRKVRVPIPKATRRVQVECAWREPDGAERLALTLNGERQVWDAAMASSGILVADDAAVAEVSAVRTRPMRLPEPAALPVSPWPLARKLAMEFRDRLSPVLPLLDKLRRQPARNAP